MINDMLDDIISVIQDPEPNAEATAKAIDRLEDIRSFFERVGLTRFETYRDEQKQAHAVTVYVCDQEIARHQGNDALLRHVGLEIAKQLRQFQLEAGK